MNRYLGQYAGDTLHLMLFRSILSFVIGEMTVTSISTFEFKKEFGNLIGKRRREHSLWFFPNTGLDGGEILLLVNVFPFAMSLYSMIPSKSVKGSIAGLLQGRTRKKPYSTLNEFISVA